MASSYLSLLLLIHFYQVVTNFPGYVFFIHNNMKKFLKKFPITGFDEAGSNNTISI